MFLLGLQDLYQPGVNITDDITFNGASYNVLWDKSDNQLEFGTNAKLSFGDAMQIYHDGSNSLIQDSGTGHVQVRSGTFTVGNAGLTKTSAIFNLFGQQLNFNNNQKFITTNTGVVISGICTATSFSGSGEGLTRTTQLSHRNIIINGDMRMSQKGNVRNFQMLVYMDYPSIDRMKIGRNGVTGTFAQVGDAPAGKGFHFSAKMTTTSAVGSIAGGNAIQINIHIEGTDVGCLGYGTFFMLKHQ